MVKEARLIKIISPEMVRRLARTAFHAEAVGRRRSVERSQRRMYGRTLPAKAEG